MTATNSCATEVSDRLESHFAEMSAAECRHEEVATLWVAR